ncbi:MAG: 50S ribosomal protein L29 [Candidatus Gracilibacteria bacterium]|nr:50S ribosomal protein L29 [Candidatus Gracilibacteria bacterium]
MKPIEIDQLRKMDSSKLQEELETVKKELFKVSFEVKNGQSKNSHLVRNYKKYIARIQTILNSQK